MLNKYFHLIINLSKYILPVILLLLLAPYLIQFNIRLEAANLFFQTYQLSFLIYHALFYLALYCSWPSLITVLVNRNQYKFNESQIQLALQARTYLLTTLVFFEFLVWWK